jgi:multiple sugar transport system permease protein
MKHIFSLQEKAPLRRILIYVIASIAGIFSLFPIYWMGISAFRAPTALFSQPSLIPGPFSLEYVDILLRQTNYPRYYLNSTVIAFLVTMITVSISLLMAYSLTRFKIRGASLIVYSMLYAYMFPAILLAIPLYTMFVRMGMDDTLLSLVICHCTFTVPLGIWLLLGFFKNLPMEIEEAALVDGASRFQAFRKVTLPLTLPGLITVAIFSFILSWTDYVYALIMISSENMKTVPLGLASMLGAWEIRWGEIMFGSTLISIPLLLLFAFLSRYFIQGLTAGALKE